MNSIIRIPTAKVSQEIVTIASIISHDEYLNMVVWSEDNSPPEEMIPQIASLEVVCQAELVDNNESYDPLVIYNANHRRRFRIDIHCIIYCGFLTFGVVFFWYTREEKNQV